MSKRIRVLVPEETMAARLPPGGDHWVLTFESPEAALDLAEQIAEAVPAPPEGHLADHYTVTLITHSNFPLRNPDADDG